MHFRQILGRILRVTNSKNQEAIMYMPAEPKLLEYAYRVNQDVPFEADVVKFEKIETAAGENTVDENLSDITFNKQSKKPSKTQFDFDNFADFFEQPAMNNGPEATEKHFLTGAYERIINISGRFQQEAIALGLSELR